MSILEDTKTLNPDCFQKHSVLLLPTPCVDDFKQTPVKAIKEFSDVSFTSSMKSSTTNVH